MKDQIYYLGLDIGTDSVGYAVTDETYQLRKFRGEPMWGVTTFEAANDAAERRAKRTARRSLDRRQQRVQLLEELFAPEICKNDAQFFVRRRESALFAEDAQAGVSVFGNQDADRAYYAQYPTIHHLIVELTDSREFHDARLVFLACSWLAAHRGHFLLEVSAEQIGSFEGPYADFCAHFRENRQIDLPWPEDQSEGEIESILKKQLGVSKKREEFCRVILGGKKPPKAGSDGYPLNRDAIIKLLCGGSAKPKELYLNDEYEEIDGSVTLFCDEDAFDEVVLKLNDEDGELLRLMRKLYDCVVLNRILSDGNHGTYPSISAAKVATYDQHKADLEWLKKFIRKYRKDQYFKLFRAAENGNYTSYSHNVKSCSDVEKMKFVNKDVFCDYLNKIVKDIKVDQEDQEKYNDMITRLELRTFLPKQKDPDNRVIPRQLYQVELEKILENAKGYLPFLNQRDETGLSIAEKIVSVFTFRIPYFVGPLNAKSEHAWIIRKAEGRIYPWNFESMVDFDKSEQAFIDHMTNTCSYLPGEAVLPENSLLYSRFTVLNAINNLRINDREIPVKVKQDLFRILFVEHSRKVTKAGIKKQLISLGLMTKTDELTGVDDNVNASLRSYHAFRNLLVTGLLTEEDVEKIINHAAYCEDQRRMTKWLAEEYPRLSDADRSYVAHLKLKGFGRLSKKLLTDVIGAAAEGTGEALSIMDMLWNTNENLMQLLSQKYQFRAAIENFSKEYYADPKNRKSLSKRLDDLYVSNAVKRPIIRTLDVVSDVVKAAGKAPTKIFIEMARGAKPDQKGKRTITRRQQLLELYKAMKTKEAKEFASAIEKMGDTADNRLQSDKLFLYYTQLGKCMYTGQPIELEQLGTERYDIDHIYPRSKVKDDSILNNKVLVLSKINGEKGDTYPIGADIRSTMTGFWTMLHDHKLITDEKFKRLTRAHGFTEDELHQFINRQLVETRQSTKVVAQLLQERYPDTKIVYVKAGMVSEFRQEFGMLKCRSVNDLHHAKDAYLNIVVGNIYHEKFTRRWFNVNQEYSLKTKTVFSKPLTIGGKTVWRGEDDIALVRKNMGKNAAHLTRYAFCRKGGLFDQKPVKAAEGLVPRKAGLPTEKYGGYNKTTASFYLLVSFLADGKKDAIFVPVELRFTDLIQRDKQFAETYLKETIAAITKKPATDICILLGGRRIKVYSKISLDGLVMELRGKMNGGAYIITSVATPLILGYENELYIKRMESFMAKKQENKSIRLDEKHDGINRAKNKELFLLLRNKLKDGVFSKIPSRDKVYAAMENGEDKFEELSTEAQVECLMSIVGWFGAMSTCNLKGIGGVAQAGAKYIGARLSQIGKTYKDVRLVDQSAAGLFECRSENLMDIL